MKKNIMFLILVLAVVSNAQLKLPRSGMNVAWQDFYYITTGIPFTNAIKNAGGWNENPGFPLDENGYVTSLQEGQTARMFIFLENFHYPTGEYTFMWEGEGEITIETCNHTYQFDENSTSPQVITVSQSCESGISLTISATNPQNYVRNLRLFLPGYDNNSGTWTDSYINYIANFGVVRFCWGSGANYSNIENWNQRRKLSDLFWTAGDSTDIGVPYEAMIELANAAKVDLWITVPVRANDEYERSMANLVKTNLNKEHRYWMEWGNESWNCGVWGYEACTYLTELYNQDPEIDRPIHYGRETIKTSDNFIQVFNETNERNRLIVVLAGQTGNAWQLQTAADEVSRLGKMNNIDVMAQGPYFSQTEDFDPLTPALNQPLDSIMVIVEEIADSLFNPISVDGAEFHKNMAVAAQYNKPMVAYEGGQHFTNWIGMENSDVARINRHPRMYDIYKKYFDNWEKAGGSTFIHYATYGVYDHGEAFGMKEYYNQPLSETHKLRAALEWEEAVTSVESEDILVTDYILEQNYPNPFNPTTQIEYSIKESGFVKLSVYNLLGELVETLVSENQKQGTYKVDFNAENLSSGIYFYRIQAKEFVEVKKMILLK